MSEIARVLAGALLAALALVDIRERRVPRLGQLALLILILADVLFIAGGPHWRESILGALLAGAAGWLAYQGGRAYGRWRGLSKERVIFGAGDARVLALAGAMLGRAAVPELLLLSALLGGALALACLLALILRRKPIDLQLNLPYIPPIALAAGWLLTRMG